MPVTTSSHSTGLDPVRLVRTHQVGVWRYLRALGCDPALADDLTQETFLAVLQRPLQEVSEAATLAYLRTTARNFLINHHRRAGRVTAVSDVEIFDRAWSRWAGDDSGDELLAVLRDCLTGLGDRARRALELRFRDDLPRERIAAALELSEDGAKNLLQRAKSKLRDCVMTKLS